jgi:hypothetical protein
LKGAVLCNLYRPKAHIIFNKEVFHKRAAAKVFWFFSSEKNASLPPPRLPPLFTAFFTVPSFSAFQPSFFLINRRPFNTFHRTVLPPVENKMLFTGFPLSSTPVFRAA